jgi:Tol biopolymer transport system component
VQSELVRRAQRGDEEAFAALVPAAVDRLVAVAYRILRDPGLAEDATQQALVIAWRKLPTLRDPERFDAWTYRLVVNACYAEAGRRRLAWCHGVQVQTGIIDVWTMNANGTDKFQVTNLGGRSFFPDFSPDGTKIVFNSRPAGATDFDLFVVNPDGTGLVQLTTGPANEVNPAWSPDGNRIVFTSDSTGVGQVWVMDASGANQTQLTFDDTWKDQVPDWSPDGTRISYAAGDPGDILVMNADGSNQHTVVGGPTDDFGTAWSPDGEQIAFLRFDDRTVYVVNADGSGEHAVRPFGLQAVPAWQPRGDRLP